MKSDLSAEIVGMWTQTFIHYKQYREAFYNAWLATCEHVGSRDWRDDAAEVAAQVADLIYPHWRDASCGSLSTFNRYCRSAYLSAMVGIPFVLGHYSAKDTERAVEVANADTADGTKSEKLARAFKSIMDGRQKKARRKEFASDGLFFQFPGKNETPEQTCQRFTAWLAEAVRHERLAGRLEGLKVPKTALRPRAKKAKVSIQEVYAESPVFSQQF